MDFIRKEQSIVEVIAIVSFVHKLLVVYFDYFFVAAGIQGQNYGK